MHSSVALMTMNKYSPLDIETANFDKVYEQSEYILSVMKQQSQSILEKYDEKAVTYYDQYGHIASFNGEPSYQKPSSPSGLTSVMYKKPSYDTRFETGVMPQSIHYSEYFNILNWVVLSEDGTALSHRLDGPSSVIMSPTKFECIYAIMGIRYLNLNPVPPLDYVRDVKEFLKNRD